MMGTGPENDSQTIVQAQELSRRYGEGEAAVDALSGVTVDFPTGRFAAIMGPSGSGKSTLMHMLAGLDRPTSGTVSVGGVEFTTLDDRALTQLRRDRIGFIFQTFNLLPVLTPRRTSCCRCRSRAVRPTANGSTVSSTRSGIRDRLSHRPAQLSGGQHSGLRLHAR